VHYTECREAFTLPHIFCTSLHGISDNNTNQEVDKNSDRVTLSIAKGAGVGDSDTHGDGTIYASNSPAKVTAITHV
jgi:hypothetical protein